MRQKASLAISAMHFSLLSTWQPGKRLMNWWHYLRHCFSKEIKRKRTVFTESEFRDNFPTIQRIFPRGVSVPIVSTRISRLRTSTFECFPSKNEKFSIRFGLTLLKTTRKKRLITGLITDINWILSRSIEHRFEVIKHRQSIKYWNSFNYQRKEIERMSNWGTYRKSGNFPKTISVNHWFRFSHDHLSCIHF